MSSPIVRKKDTGQSGNPGQFAHIGREESGVTLGAPDHEALYAMVSHHVDPVIGWARAAAGNRSMQESHLQRLDERSALAGVAIAQTMTGDRADWAGKAINARLRIIVKELLSSNTDPQGRYVTEQSVDDYNHQLDQLAETFAREAHTEDPLPVNGMPILASVEDGYVNKLDEDGNLIHQVRLVNGKPQDCDDGTAAIISYDYASTRERHYIDGKLHDGSGDTPSQRVHSVRGETAIERGYIRPHGGYITHQDSPDGQPAEQITYERDEVDRGRLSDREAGEVLTRWSTAGRRQNPAPGIPAVTITHPDGRLTEIHSPFGRVQDLADGTPSERSWSPEGQLTLEVRRYNDALWDSDSGEPAYRRWDNDGALLEELHYENHKPRTRHNPEAPRRAETAYYAPTEPFPRFEG